MDNKMIDLAMDAVNAQIRKNCDDKNQITLGELAVTLEKYPESYPVEFDSGGCPDTYDSYRGYYDMISVCTGAEGTNDAGTFAQQTREAIGKTYYGYKGGNFTMNRSTPVWVAEYGQCTGIGIVGVEEKEEKVILITAEIED